MSDEKRAERLLKRAKPFLDEKLKAKQRLTALSSFVENSNVQEQQKFFHEHDYQIYTVMFDCFTHQVDKIKTREKPDKPVSINSKEVADLLRSLQILKKIIVYLPEKMRAGWQRRSIVGILQALLVTGNHVKLRIEGLRLLLLYLAQQPPEVQDTIPLYANAISLSVFDAFVIPPPIATAHTYCENQGIDSLLPTEGVAVWKGEGKGQLNQDVIEWERRIHTLNGPASVGGSGGSSTMDRTVLLPSSTPFTIYDAMDMFEEILSHLVIVAGETPATQSTATASLQVPSVRGHRGSVVEKVHPEAKETEVGTDAPNVSTPSVSRNGSLAATDTTPAKSILDISAQPADGLSIMWGHFRNHYLRLLFPQVARLSGMQVSDEEGFATCPPQLLHALLNFLIRNCVDSSVNTSSTSLRRLLLSGDVQNLELVHEWIHQAMLLPYVWSDVMRGAIAIVRVWCAQADEERPPFLQMFSPEAVSPVEGPGGDVDSYLRRYIRYLRLAFSVKVDDVEHMDHQLAIFREVIFLFRSFTLDTMQPSLTPQSWHTLFATLFDVTVHLLCRPSPTAVVRDSAMAIEIADLLLETAFITAVRSGIKDDDLWSTLRSILQRCTRWAECIGNWETTLTTLTTILATHTYSVELDPLHQLKHRANQNAASASPSTHIGHHPPHRAPASVSSFVTHHSSSSSKRDRSNSFIANTLHRGADAKKRANTEVSSNSLKGARSDPEVFVGGGKSQTAESPRTWGLGAFGTSKRDVDRHVEGEETVGEALVLNKRTFAILGQAKGSNVSLSNLTPESKNNPAQSPIPVYHRPTPSADFMDLISLPIWDETSASFMWKNVLCILGDINQIENQQRHAEAMRCLAKIWGVLEKIRLAQLYEKENGGDLKMPPLFEFTTWFLKGADMDDEYADGRAIAYGALCRIMWRRHDQPFLEDYYPHFYRLLTKGLSSSDPQVITAILSNSRKLFVLGLPGSYILVKPFLCCIRNMSGTSYTPGILNLPATVHQNAITILQSLISVPNHYTTPTPTIRRPGSAPPHMQSSSSASPRTLAPSRMTKGEDLQVGSDYSINRERHGIHRSSPKSIVTSSLGVLPPPLLTPSPASLVAAARTCSSEISAPTARTAKTFAASMTQLTTRGKYEDTARSHPISLTSDVAVQETRGVSHPDLTLGLTSTPHRTTGGTLFGVPSIGDAAEQLESYVPSGGKIISSEEMKLAIKDTLVFLLSSSPEDRDITSLQMLNWSVATMLFDEIVNSANPNKAVLDDCLSALLRNLTHRDVAVVYAASDGLSLLAQNRDILGKLDKHMLQFVLETLVNTTMDLLLLQHGHSGSQVRALCVSRLLYCLLDWVMIFPDDVRDYTKLADMIFDVIEQALNVPLEVDISVSSGDSERGQPVPFKRGGRTSVYEGNIFQRHSSDGGRPGPGDKADAVAAAPLSAVTGGKGMEDAAGNTMIKDTAEIVLTHILNHVHNFAPPYGAAMMGSQILDPSLQEEGSRRESDKYLYFSFNRTTLITLVEIPGRTPLDTRARLIIRDMSGRYCWDSSLFYESLHNMRKRLHSGRSNVFNDISNRFAADPCQYRGVSQSLIFPEGVGLESHPRELEADSVTYHRNEEDMPIFRADAGVESADMLDELLQFIGQTHTDCLLEPDTPLNVPSDIHPPMKEAVQETSRLMQRQLDNEVDCTRNFLSNTSFRNRTSSIDTNLARSDSVNQLSIPSSGGDGALRRRATVAHVPVGIGNQWDTLRRTPSSFDTLELPPTKDYLHVTPSTHLRVTPPFQRARLLLSHLGLIDFDSLRDGELCLLAETPALFRDVKVLDRKHGRETIKVAVIYVAPGQEDEHSIFRNESGSVEYEAFVSSLGWDVDLGSHPGFVGGLERSLANGKTATYFCTSTYEILFHDVTKMPVDQHDAKQLKKKRHIGNDQVHIVWNEHHRDYRRNTIGGDFGNAQIIVTPRTDGLYSIEVLRDEKVPSFGPLHNVTVVSKSILGPLVRQTALNAYRATLAMGDMAAATTMLVGGKQGGKGAVGGTSHTASISSATSISSARTAPSSHAVPLQPRHAFAARREDIVTIADRHKLGKWTFEKFIEAVFATAPEFSTGQQRQECVSSYDFNESPSLGSGESSTSGANERSGPTTLTRIVSGLVA